LMVGFFINGALYARLGSFGLFQVSAWIALAGGVVFGTFQLLEGRRARDDSMGSDHRSKNDDG